MFMYKSTIIFLLLTCIPLKELSCLPDGAPEKVCESMLPFHGGGIKPSNTVAPFLIEVSSSTITQEQNVEVTVEGLPPRIQFSGFMLQARNAYPPHEAIGMFSFGNELSAKFMHCTPGINNSITHKNTNLKSSLNVLWHPPANFLGQVYFNGTIAQSYDTFWVGILSAPVRVLQRGAALEASDTQTTHSVYTLTKATYIPSPEILTPPPKKNDQVYAGCGVNKTCFGFPDDCLKDKSCKLLSRVSVRGDIFQFELISENSFSTYIALGLSEDGKMGNDLVTECFVQDGKVHHHSSFTSGPPSYGTSRSVVFQRSARLLKSSFNDGAIYCKVERDALIEVETEKFDLINKKYHLLLAMGSSVKENGVGYHDLGRIPSALPINLAEVQDIYGSSTVLLRLHGALMAIAWIGTTSLGILLARYFKRSWVGRQICGKDIWFSCHRGCMMTTWFLTMLAFVVILVEIKGWSAERNPHAILGLITTILCFAQFFFGLFRPGPVSKIRPLFNWTHWLIGNLAHILAFITIFFSVKLAKAELPKWMDLILVYFVGFHVVIHLIYSVAGCISDRHLVQRSNAFQMQDMSARHEIKTQMIDAPYSGIRKWLLVLYVVVLSLFVIILVLIITLAPIDKTFEKIKSVLSS